MGRRDSRAAAGARDDAGNGEAVDRARRAVVRGLPFALAAVLACTPAPPETISRQDFVTVFVELRKAEIISRDAVISEQARDSVLTAHGVSQDDMLAFADVHGADPEFMAGVWSEVQERMDAFTQER